MSYLNSVWIGISVILVAMLAGYLWNIKDRGLTDPAVYLLGVFRFVFMLGLWLAMPFVGIVVALKDEDRQGLLRSVLIGLISGIVYMFTRYKTMFARIYITPFPVSPKRTSDSKTVSVRHAISRDLRSIERAYSQFMTS